MARVYEPVETEIEGQRFRCHPLGVIAQSDLIFDVRDLFGKGLKEAFGLDVKDVFRAELDPNYKNLSAQDQDEITLEAVFTKLPSALFRFLLEVDRHLFFEAINRYLPKILIHDSGNWREVEIEGDLDATKLVHFKLLSWFLAVQLGPFTGFALMIGSFLQKLLPEERSIPSTDTAQT